MKARAVSWTRGMVAFDSGVQERFASVCQAPAAGPTNACSLTLRVLELVARDKACEHPDKACHGDACPLARGFYDRLPQAREAAAQAGWLDKASLRALALRHEVCPYYLGQDMLRWSDVVVGDYNHFFDLSAHAWALTVGEPWRVGLLVDEAHNLIERARLMHSATLEPAAFQALRQAAPAALKKPLETLQHYHSKFARPLGENIPNAIAASRYMNPEYDKLIEKGIFLPDDRIELLAGEMTKATLVVHTHKPPRPKPPRPEGV